MDSPSQAEEPRKYIGTPQAVTLTGLSESSLKRLRLSGKLIEGCHWVRVNGTRIRYNQPLLLDWMANQADPQAHLKAIERHRHSLMSNQSRKRT